MSAARFYVGDCGCNVTPECHNQVLATSEGHSLRDERYEGPGSSCRQAVSSTDSVGSTPGPSTKWRRGLVLDCFVGSGTTLAAASEQGRDSIGIDLDERNLDLARQRVGMFLEEVS